MIFADKLITLRKKHGMTQEELAEIMGVSRQSIAKWEGALSVPELSRIIKLSEVFDVSLDYLLKDEIEEIVPGQTPVSEGLQRQVSMEAANKFLALRQKAAATIALGTFLCMISPTIVIMLAGLSEPPVCLVSENVAVGIGLSCLLVIVAVAVAIFLKTGAASEDYEFLEKEDFDTAYGVEGMVRERRAQFKPTRDRYNMIGTVACILASIPLFVGAVIGEDNEVLLCALLCLLLIIAAVGVVFYIRAGVVWASFDKLLQQGDYTPQHKKEANGPIGMLSTAYWLIVVAIFLGYSFSTNDWGRSWLIFAIAGILFPVQVIVLHAVFRRGQDTP